MIVQTAYLESHSFDPYENLALEEYLLRHCRKGQCILYLWQNQKTVVIGKNQNAWAECRTEALEEDGGKLARRLSGGGAVFHDLGNLNFTFLVCKEDYNIKRQMEVILKAARKLGVKAEKSGRNDILAEGKKFSGNAFYEQGEQWYHHGTLMVDVDLDNLTQYLTVSKEKLRSKGVASVKSRVANLKEFVPDLTVEELKKALREAFEEVYGYPARVIGDEDLDQKEIERERAKYSSWEWKYGKKLRFQYEQSHRFPWGSLQIQFQICGGKVEDAGVYSDSLKPELIEAIGPRLCGLRYEKRELLQALGTLPAAGPEEQNMVEEICGWLRTVDL